VASHGIGEKYADVEVAAAVEDHFVAAESVLEDMVAKFGGEAQERRGEGVDFGARWKSVDAWKGKDGRRRT
jgi:hypothetical protein